MITYSATRSLPSDRTFSCHYRPTSQATFKWCFAGVAKVARFIFTRLISYCKFRCIFFGHQIDVNIIRAATCDFQQCGILTSVDSCDPVLPHFKLRNSKCCLVSSTTVIDFSSDLQRLRSDYAQADLRLC